MLAAKLGRLVPLLGVVVDRAVSQISVSDQMVLLVPGSSHLQLRSKKVEQSNVCREQAAKFQGEVRVLLKLMRRSDWDQQDDKADLFLLRQ